MVLKWKQLWHLNFENYKKKKQRNRRSHQNDIQKHTVAPINQLDNFAFPAQQLLM